VAHGIILAAHQRFAEARQALETAVALGARSPEAYYYLADCTLRFAPKRIDAAEAAVRQALKVAPDDPWIRSLAGRLERLRTTHREPASADDEPPYPTRLFLQKPPRDW
jgi:Flp pilus assembly protein TadD